MFGIRQRLSALVRHPEGKSTFYIAAGALLVALVFFQLAADPFSLARFVSPAGNSAAVIAAALTDLANADRAASGIGMLTVDPVLTAAAQAKADDMAARGYFAHFDPQGKGPWDWMREYGYHYRYAGENLAIQFGESADVERAWLNSPAHRANLLDPRFTQVGIAVAQGMYEGQPTTFVVQFFGTPATILAIADTPETSPASQPQPELPPETASSSKIRVLGLVEDAPETKPKRIRESDAATTTATSTSLLLTAAPPADVPLLPAPKPAAGLVFLSAVHDAFSPVALFLPIIVALILAFALVEELRERHLAHAFSAISLSAAFALLAIATALPSIMPPPILDASHTAFTSQTGDSIAMRVKNTGVYYVSGAPAIAQTAAVASADPSALRAVLLVLLLGTR